MLKLHYKINEKPFVCTVSERELHNAFKKILRNYFQISKEDVTVHVTKARWIIDYFLGIPFLEEREMLEYLIDEFRGELEYFFYDKAREESER